MIYKFKTNSQNEIIKYEIIKETKLRITYIKFISDVQTKEYKSIEVTENKKSMFHSWHDTFEDAKNYLINWHNLRIEYFKKEIENTTLIIEKIKLLVENV